MRSPSFLIDELKLTPHPEGGYYREIYSSNDLVDGSLLSEPRVGKRSLSTSIYFLLKSGEISQFHRLRSDEIWYFHFGSTIIIHVIDIDGRYNTIRLGSSIERNEVLQVVIPAGTIFGAEVKDINSYSLVGCMVSPGFHFEDFELMKRNEMLNIYPGLKDVILKFTSDK
ncbi:MAG: cupin domain-containing protein [Ignavibacteria bacterium]|jgi:predicted cupin superfamily sugar epimerase